MTQLVYENLNVHVSASDEEVIAELKTRLKERVMPSPGIEQSVLAAHHDARQLFKDWRF